MPLLLHLSNLVRLNNPTRPDAFGVKRCRDEITSGKYHAIVVIDYSDRDLTNEFEEAFGTLLQQFVRAGGVVAFPSSESCLVSTLQDFFDADWGYGEYYRTNWGPCLEDNESNIHRNFGSGTLSRSVIRDFSAKGNTIRVPKHERCFGVTERSRTHADRLKKAGEEDYDVVVAVHDFGEGAIAYFGDVNAEDQTIALVAAFVESRSPKQPVDNLPKIKDSFSDMDRLWDNEIMGNMEWALPGDTVKFHGLNSAAHLNGTEGMLVKFIESQQRWSVRCLEDNHMVTAKPENLKVQASHFRMREGRY